METLKLNSNEQARANLRAIVDHSFSFMDAVRRVMDERGVKKGKAIRLVAKAGTKGGQLFNEWCAKGSPQTF